MKLDPIDPQKFTDFVSYSEKTYPLGTLSGQNQAALCSDANHCTGGLCGLFQPVHVNLVFLAHTLFT